MEARDLGPDHLLRIAVARGGVQKQAGLSHNAGGGDDREDRE
jgi:hypothetical protein